MKCLVLRAFEYSLDGINVFSAATGDIVDIPDALVPGLSAECFVSEPKNASTPDPRPPPAAKMMPPLENKAPKVPRNTTATGNAPKSK